MIAVGVYTFEAKIAYRGHHVYKETSWSKAPGGEEVNIEIKTSQSSKNVEPYACVVCTKKEYSKGYKKQQDITREIYRDGYYFIKTEGGLVNGTVISTKFLPGTIQLVD